MKPNLRKSGPQCDPRPVLRLKARAALGEITASPSAKSVSYGILTGHEQRVDLVEGLGPGLHRAAAGHDESSEGTHQSFPVLGESPRLSGQHGAGRRLSINRGAVASPPAGG